jgi:GntR family transcriptional regulator, N-acetylglucosamine utilization regulator
MTTDHPDGNAPDRSTDIPLYRRIEKDLLTQIVEGRLQPGQIVPPERELCEHYGVSRITVRRAIRELETTGYVQRRQGKGTFVSRSRIRREMGRLISFSEELRMQGRVPTSRLLNLQHRPADTAIAALLQIEEGDPIWIVERLRLADGEVASMSTSYLHLPPEIYLTPMELTSEPSLWAVLEYKGILICEGDTELRAIAADAHHAQALGVAEGDPLLLREGVNYTLAEGLLPVEAFRTIARADRYHYSLHLIRQAGP